MFGLFGPKKEEVEKSFGRVREDTQLLSDWIRYLHAENQRMQEHLAVQQKMIDAQQLALRDVKVTIQHMPKTADDVKYIVDSYYNFKPVLDRIRHIEDKIESLELKQHQMKQKYEIPVQPRTYSEPSPEIVQPARTSTALQEKMMKRLVRNSKEYIKNMIRGLVQKYGRITALQLREIIVEEQGLCSKSSFYRIIDELEKEKVVDEVNEGKTKVFVIP